MKYLLDTHAFLWFVLSDAQISELAVELIADPENEVLVSPASYWELAIKISIGKYALPEPLGSFMAEQLAVNNFEVLPISVEHAEIVSSLPFHHRDPFDRMLVAQSLVEDIAIISADAALDQYAANRFW